MSSINLNPCQTLQNLSSNCDGGFKSALNNASCQPQHQQAASAPHPRPTACAPQQQPTSCAPQQSNCSDLSSEISQLQSEVSQLQGEISQMSSEVGQGKSQCATGGNAGSTGNTGHTGGSHGGEHCGNSQQTNWGNSNWGVNTQSCSNQQTNWGGSNWGGNYQNCDTKTADWGHSNWTPQGNDCSTTSQGSGSHGTDDQCHGAGGSNGGNSAGNCANGNGDNDDTNVSLTNNCTTGSVTFGNDDITFDKSSSTITVKNTCTGETTTVWGDPHVVSPDGTTESYNGNLSFNLGDGTTLTVLTADSSNNAITTGSTSTLSGNVSQNAFSNTAIISNGRQTVTVNNISQDNAASLSMSETEGKPSISAGTTQLNEVNKEWVAA